MTSNVQVHKEKSSKIKETVWMGAFQYIFVDQNEIILSNKKVGGKKILEGGTEGLETSFCKQA